jgi:hypothetical protein
VDSSDNVYVVGFGYNIVGGEVAGSGQDWWIKKYGSKGIEDTGWEKKLDGNRGDDKHRGITTDTEYDLRYVYIVGYGSNLASDSSGYDWWIQKFDAASE